jgi:hypothetical protein
MIQRTLRSPYCAGDALQGLTEVATSPPPARARDFQQQRAAAKFVARRRESASFGHERQDSEKPCAGKTSEHEKGRRRSEMIVRIAAERRAQ